MIHFQAIMLRRGPWCPLTRVFQNHAPSWYKTPLAGPAAGPGSRRVGCNGMVCYCNNQDFCNAKDGMTHQTDATSRTTLAPLLLLLPLALH